MRSQIHIQTRNCIRFFALYACLFPIALLLSTCVSKKQNQGSNVNLGGVLIRSERGASSLPSIIVPSVALHNETIEVFARYLENKILGNAQWSDRGRHIKVNCRPEVRAKVFSLAHESSLSALELLIMVANETQTLIVVDEWEILIQKRDIP